MNDYLFIFPITIALLLGVLSPGPSFFLVAQTAMSNSRKNALFISLGMGIGAMTFAFIAMSGLYVLIQTSEFFYTILKICGGLYLLYLAYKIFMSTKSTVLSEGTNLHVSKKKYFLTGLLTQLSNPKTAIIIGSIFAAFLPQEIPSYSIVLLCSIAFILDTGWYSIVAILLSTKKAQKAYINYQKHINIASSIFITFIAIKLFIN